MLERHHQWSVYIRIESCHLYDTHVTMVVNNWNVGAQSSYQIEPCFITNGSCSYRESAANIVNFLSTTLNLYKCVSIINRDIAIAIQNLALLATSESWITKHEYYHISTCKRYNMHNSCSQTCDIHYGTLMGSNTVMMEC